MSNTLFELKKATVTIEFLFCDLVFSQNFESYPVDTSLIFSFFLPIKLRIPEITPLS